MTETNQEWIVQLFRRNLNTGWESLEVQASSKKSGNSKKAPTARLVLARPLAGAIVVPRLRFRMKLATDTVVTRRQHLLRVQSKHGVRVLVLVFENTKACDSFCDRLLRLNPLPAKKEPSLTHRYHLETKAVTSSTDQQQSVLFYVARLLYDPDFLQLVRALEQTFFASEEGQKILHDLQTLLPPTDDDKVVVETAALGVTNLQHVAAAPMGTEES